MLIGKRKVFIIIEICIVFFAIFYILQRPISKKKELEATGYTVNDGEYETTILIDGEISKEGCTHKQDKKCREQIPNPSHIRR